MKLLRMPSQIILVTLLLLAVSLTLVLSRSPEAFAGDPTESDPARTGPEIISMRSENAQYYQLPSGKIRCDIYAADIYFRGPSGNLMAIDNALTTATARIGYKLTNAANSWHASFADTLLGDSSVLIEKGESSLAFGLEGSDLRASVAPSSVLKGASSQVDKELAQDNRSAVYRNVLPDVDVAYTVLTGALKETIILRHRTAPSAFTFVLRVGNLKPVTTDGQTTFADGKGNNVLSMSPMYMEDAAGKCSQAVTYTIEPSDGGYKLTVSADPSFLAAEDTVYPVVIDPTYNTTGTNYTADTYAYSASSSAKPYTSSYLRTGVDQPYGTRRTFIRFKLPSGYRAGSGSADGITDARIKLKLYSSGSAYNSIRAYKCQTPKAYWASSEVCWSDMPTYSSSGSFNAAVYNGWYTMDVSDTVHTVYSGGDNYGYCVKEASEGVWQDDRWATFYSSDCGNSAYTPILSITWDGTYAAHATFGGHWASSAHIEAAHAWYSSDANALAGPEIRAVWSKWNGINSHVNVVDCTTTIDPADAVIHFYTQNLTSIAETWLIDASGNTNYGGTWVRAEIWIDPRSGTGYYSGFHDDIQQEILIHELGHAFGLAHLPTPPSAWDSCCIMRGFANWYCFPIVTSHDQQTLNLNYP